MPVLVKGSAWTEKAQAQMAADTRDRMIEATVAALQRHGVAGMSFTEVLNSSGAARGAIYHHFPGGKRQLVGEAAEHYGSQVREHLAALPADTPVAVVDAFFAAVRPVVEASAQGGGCAVAAVAVDAGLDHDEEQRLRTIAATAFSAWTDQLAERLTAAGLDPDRAQDLATMLIALLEGAHVLCRAAGTLAPFDRASRTAKTYLT